MTPADALAHVDPFDPRLDGALYVRQVPDRAVTDDDVNVWLGKRGSMPTKAQAMHALVAARLGEEHKVILVSGLWLSSQAETAFSLDGVEYPTLRRFYEALKMPEDVRARFVAGTTRRELGLGRGHHDATFSYADREIAVGSLAHSQLIARAVSAKVAAHAQVRSELARTGRARLVMGGPTSQLLGRITPFALMVERLRLAER
jgi:predicted NAD-dependent protein-ADP-ribosyltransferase YbiA (DUF1768 family)